MNRLWKVTGALAATAVISFVLGVHADERLITRQIVQSAQKIMGLEFTVAETDSMLDELNEYADAYETLRTVRIPNDVPPAFQFNPIPTGKSFPTGRDRFRLSRAPSVERPGRMDDLAFMTVRELGALVKNRQVTSMELTRLFIDRLRRYGPELECVITITEETAIEQARRADREIERGLYRGHLHGIPYGIKDLFATKDHRTTWGSEPYKDQIIHQDATVVQKLEEAGAVLVAKLTLGALAWGDVWYGGMTRNPWNLEQGSSGSSAGSSAATAAGLVPFAIGTETWGSIVSPSARCGTTGLRPTFGRVSRAGAMALSWTMDKVGPICRSVEDCALVLQAICGPDGIDASCTDLPFYYDANITIGDVRIGYVPGMFEEEYENRGFDNATLNALREMGGELVPMVLPAYPLDVMPTILVAEAAAAFDELTRSGEDDMLVRQIKNAWPNVFRAARFIPAVEYIQANRVRHQIIQDMETLMERVDVYVTPSFGGSNLLLTNLTGHPCVVLPNGFREDGTPVSITFMGRLYDEGTLLAVARDYQEATDFHRRHPGRYQ
jgi:Asp-tRNA(Asn)/Glu-tRNA(Gln) amidotransferase A subunit family amidase